MKRQYAAVMIAAIAAASMIAACGKENKKAETAEAETTTEASAEDMEMVEGDADMGDYPSNSFEERVGKVRFESYDEIISLLEGEEAYAYVNMKGHEGPVLLVTDFVYDNMDGSMAAVEATPYSKKADGTYSADSVLVAGGTANPLAVDDEGIVYCATHSTMEKQCYGENGTGIPAVMIMESIYTEEFDENGMPAKVGGFIRTNNDVINDDSRDIAEDEIEEMDRVFEEYENAHVIGFTAVDGRQAEAVK